MAEKRKTDAIDRHVGDRVRMCRIMRQMTQIELGTKIGVTFQQLQKYEKGSNRIGASRLYRIAQILDTPIAFFFEDLPGSKGGGTPLPDYLIDLMSTALGQRLVQGLARVSDSKMRYNFAELVESITEQPRQKRKRSR